MEIGKNFSNGDNQVLDIKGKSSDQRDIADAFNNYFLSISDTITKNKTHNKTGNDKDIISAPLYFLSRISKNSFPVVGLKSVSTKEIRIILISQK